MLTNEVVATLPVVLKAAKPPVVEAKKSGGAMPIMILLIMLLRLRLRLSSNSRLSKVVHL